MASIKQLKKKINQQSFKVLHAALFSGANQNTESEGLANILEEAEHFQQESLKRIQASRYMEKKERRAELKSVEEQLTDKETYFQKAISA